MSRSRSLLAALLLAALQAALLVHTAWDKSDTIDEATYLRRSIDLMFWQKRPALPPSWLAPQWTFAWALRLADPDGGAWPRPHQPWPPADYAVPKLRLILLAARLPTILMTVAAGLLLWSAVRRWGERPALVALALWCTSPAVLAHGSLATMDPWLAGWVSVQLWTVVRAFERPTGGRLAATAVPFALGVSTKLTYVLVAPVLGALLFVLLRRAPRPARIRWAMAWAAAALGTVWAAYGFTIGPLNQELLRDFKAPALDLGFIPFPGFVENLLAQVAFGSQGHQGYLFGEVSHTGWWWFYLAVLALKTTIGAQLLALLAVAATIRHRPDGRDAALLAFPAMLLLVLSVGAAQSGIRYLLPAFPCFFAWLGLAGDRAIASFGQAGRAVVMAALALGAAGSLSGHPHHLMFFNTWAGGPGGGPRYLIHSDDWGQDQRRLGEWMAAAGVPFVHYTYYNGNPEAWGVRWTEVPCEPRKGVYALQAVEVHRPRQVEEGCLDWLTREPPDERLGWSIYVYAVDKTQLERLRQPVPAGQRPFWASAPNLGR